MGHIISFYLGASFGFLFMVPMITGEYELQEHKFQKIVVWGLMALCWPGIAIGIIASFIKLSVGRGEV